MEYVDFDTAKKLRDKGFPQHWSDQDYILENEYEDDFFEVGSKYSADIIYDYIPTIAAPTISQVLKWLREEKKIFVEIALSPEGYRHIIYTGLYCMRTPAAHHFTFDGFYNPEDLNYMTYEQAAIAGIEFVLDNLI